MQNIPLKRGETDPPIEVLITDAGGMIDLLNTRLEWRMKQRGGPKLIVATAEAINALDITADPNVRYTLAADGSDTDTPGVYDVEVWVYRAYGTPAVRKAIHPSERDLTITVGQSTL